MSYSAFHLCQPFGPGFGIHVFRNVIATVRSDLSAMHCDCCICCRQAGLRMFCTPCTTAIEKAACESLSSRSLTSTSTRRPAIAIQCAYLSHPGWACCPWLRTCIFILGSTEVQLKDYVSRRFCWKCRDARVSFCKCEELLDLPNHTEVCAACLSAPVHQLYGYTVTNARAEDW